MDREELNPLDRDIFRGSDTPLDAKDDVFALIVDQVERKLVEMSDSSEVIHIEVYIPILYRLSSYFGNVWLKRTTAMLWKNQVFMFLDGEAERQGRHFSGKCDEEWRSRIEANFNRLIEVLPE